MWKARKRWWEKGGNCWDSRGKMLLADRSWAKCRGRRPRYQPAVAGRPWWGGRANEKGGGGWMELRLRGRWCEGLVCFQQGRKVNLPDYHAGLWQFSNWKNNLQNAPSNLPFSVQFYQIKSFIPTTKCINLSKTELVTKKGNFHILLYNIVCHRKRLNVFKLNTEANC